MGSWQVQQAKSRLTELIRDAKTRGPQIITKHGSETAVVLSIAEYKALQYPEPKMDFVEFLLNAPKFESVEEEQIFENLRDPSDTGRNLDDLFEAEEA
jgi:antitoxin Phd